MLFVLLYSKGLVAYIFLQYNPQPTAGRICYTMQQQEGKTTKISLLARYW